MDRKDFLASMPWISPCPSSMWPPRKTETLLETKNSAVSFKLSLEPSVEINFEYLDQLKKANVQPAFFGRPTNNDDNKVSSGRSNHSGSFDPSMTTIQVAAELSSLSAERNLSQEERSVLEGRVLFTGEIMNNVDKSKPGHQGDSSSSSRTHLTPGSTKTSTATVKTSTPRVCRGESSWPLSMYFRISDDPTVFQLDGRHLLLIKIVHPAHSPKKGQQLPPCLILVFSCCIFRIFPHRCPAKLDDADSEGDWKEDALESLKELEKRLLQLSSGAVTTAATSSTCLSPISGSSSVPTSSGEAGQKEDAGHYGDNLSHSTLTSSGSSRTPKKLRASVNGKLQDKHQLRKIKRRRDALARSRAGLQAMETLLEMPVSLFAHVASPQTQEAGECDNNVNTVPCTDSAASEGAMPKTQVQWLCSQQSASSLLAASSCGEDMLRPLLSGIAEDIATSYGSQRETLECLQFHHQEVDEARKNKLDLILDSFFPTMPNRHSNGSARNRSRYCCGKNQKHAAVCSFDNVGGAKVTEMKPVEDAMDAVYCLMKKQKALLHERISFYQLPTRG